MKHKYIIIALSLIVCSCKKFVDVGAPQTQLQGESIFQNDATAHATQLAIYAAMESDLTGYHLVLYSGLSADELINYSSATNYIDLAANNLTPENTIISSLLMVAFLISINFPPFPKSVFTAFKRFHADYFPVKCRNRIINAV